MPKKGSRKAQTEEARENQLISSSMNAAEERILNGTASDSLLIHFLRLGTVKARLENERLKKETLLTQAKVDSLEASKRSEEKYQEVIDAMKRYGGYRDDEEEYEDYY